MPSYPALQESNNVAQQEKSAFEDEQQNVARPLNASSIVPAQSETREKIQSSDAEAEQIKAALKAATGVDNLTEAQWDEMVEKQRKLLAGEEVK